MSTLVISNRQDWLTIIYICIYIYNVSIYKTLGMQQYSICVQFLFELLQIIWYLNIYGYKYFGIGIFADMYKYIKADISNHPYSYFSEQIIYSITKYIFINWQLVMKNIMMLYSQLLFNRRHASSMLAYL